MNRKTLVILAVVIAVLLPMWFVALHGEPPSEEIAIDQSVSEMRPLEGVLDTPRTHVATVTATRRSGRASTRTCVRRCAAEITPRRSRPSTD
ncbi:hypothetical protein DV733_16195 [Halapricum salinum]|uniref:Uncharacterized protein n=1 Tax=Halapricum salinum TaxID=1457250 RepID=A0A4D6HHE5_9EURY|nr:hypothetical protein DV733_16195 [Halapricum salinum]